LNATVHRAAQHGAYFRVMRVPPPSAALAIAVLAAACADPDSESGPGFPTVRAFSASEMDGEPGTGPSEPVANEEASEGARACGRLDVMQGLARGEQLASCDERVRLFLQPDGNLILRVREVGVVWESGTGDSGAERLRMEPSGVLTLRDAAAQVLWQSHAFGLAGSYASLLDDGDLVIFDPAGRPIWRAPAARDAQH
jgi:hypothetical protein